MPRIDQLTAHPRSTSSPLRSAAVVLRDASLSSSNTRQTGIDNFRRWVSVKDYGATGDGTTDDSTAIQTAISAEPTLYFPPGTYKCNSRINLVSNRHLFGAGVDQTFVTFGPGLNFGWYSDGSSSVRTTIEISNIYFTGIKQGNFDILSIRDTDNFYVHDCTLDTCSEYSIGVTRGINHNLRVERNLFKNTGTFAMETVAYPGLDGYRSGTSTNVTFSGNEVRWDPSATAAIGDGYYGVKFSNYDGVTCTNNKFIGNPPPASVMPNSSAVQINDSTNVYVAGNYIKWAIAGVTVARGDGTSATAKNVVIAGNQIESCYYGVQLSCGEHVNVSGNVIRAGTLNGGSTLAALVGTPGTNFPLHYLQVYNNVTNSQATVGNKLTYAAFRGNMFTSLTITDPGGNSNVTATDNMTVV